ncbi:hypothetical protein [uncultured Desulfosarcina sp.]|uniref:hypothetical protein n=1 Tax=uncultured Desulfosarcina sp. TaxID=218289 RepID=UPI0029C8B0A1|nr:hypothetical protein [uncultured Desulfosarcina sp.]
MNQGISNECRGLVVPAICFEEIIEKSHLEIVDRNLSWKKYKQLFSRGESFNIRSDAISKGKKERINLPSELKRFMKKSKPEFKYKKVFGRHLFYKSISNDITYGIAFETIHHMGLGKAFTACFLIEHIGGLFSGNIWNSNVFRIFGESYSWPPCWTYTTKNDLDTVFESVDSLWEDLFPIFESNTIHYFTEVPVELPNDIKYRGAITAKEGLIEAQELALSWATDARLNSLSSGCHLSVRDQIGPAVKPNGRLKPHAYWSYNFYSPSKKHVVIVIRIPYAGKSQLIAHSYESAIGNQIQYRFKPVDDNWIDSDKAMLFAENNGGKSARNNAKKNFDIIVKFGVPSSNRTGQHQWHISYLLVNNIRNRADLHLSMDPYNGGNIKVEPF